MNQSSIAPGASPSLAEERYPVEFTATTGEYFRIWIVNLGLTLVTLGIYSGWAKVRKRRYLYSHTTHASPETDSSTAPSRGRSSRDG